MKPFYVLIYVLLSFCLSYPAEAQVGGWNTSPRMGFVFEISNNEAQALLTRSTPNKIFEGLLHTQIDTFTVSKGWNYRPFKGHFILASIKENKLHCEYTSVLPYEVILLKEYDALALQVLDRDGNVREDAIVKFKITRVRFDKRTRTYRIDGLGSGEMTKVVTVELDGFRSVFNITRDELPYWWGGGSEDGPTFYSYMITDKNKYRPGEKVRFKSFALSQSQSPLRRDLELWISNYERGDVKVGTVAPHRPGSYAGEFVLHDSLKLKLDKFYSLSLKASGDRIVSSCNFKYEDYELNGDKLAIKLSTQDHFAPQTNELSIVATDVNGFMLKDAKVTVLVRRKSVRETFQPLVILNDTLYNETLSLHHAEPTKVKIPSAWFQKTNTSYEVQVILLNSQNQRIEKAISATHYYSQFELEARFSNDSLVYSLLRNGKVQEGVSARLRHDEEEVREVKLPYRELINPALSSVSIATDAASRVISLGTLQPELDLLGGMEKDSLKLELVNPQKLKVSWYVYHGDELLERGSGSDWNYKSFVDDRSQTYHIELLYVFGGREWLERKDIVFKDDNLSVSLNVPNRVYPGQQVEATIQVLDAYGEPVSGVDLTALAVSKKVDYRLPDLPYFGSSSSPRSKRSSFAKEDLDKRVADLDLDFSKWWQKAGLDTMKYYQLIYPGARIFRNEEVTTDSTQFAPFVVQNGLAKEIYVVEVNRVPVYFSWVDRPSRYSFYVAPGKKVSVSLRLFDRVLLLDSIAFSRGKKTVLSVDLDHLPASAKVLLVPPVSVQNKKDRKQWEFTRSEQARYLPYLSTFKRAETPSFLEYNRSFTPLFNAGSSQKAIKVGPVIPGRQNYFENSRPRTTYDHEGGYTYLFSGNTVYKLSAEELIPSYLVNGYYRPVTRLNDLALSKSEFLKPANQLAVWVTRSVNVISKTMQVKVLLPEEKAASGLASIVFENCKSKTLVSPCQSRYGVAPEFSTIPSGLHNVIALYNNGTYLKMDSVDLRSYSIAVIDLERSKLHGEDDIFQRWRELGSENCRDDVATREISMRVGNALQGNLHGIILDMDQQPMPGVNVVVKGTLIGTVTDAEGRWVLNVEGRRASLVMSFIGYVAQEIEVEAGAEVVATMDEDVKQLSEVVVTGYGMTSMKHALGTSVISASGYETPDAEDKSANENNVIEKEQLYRELMALTSLRTNFSDVGFWEPRLFSDKQGMSRFSIKFPDDLTQWEAAVYAMNRRLQTGMVRKSIKSFKPVMAELNVPNFLTRGDSALLLGKVTDFEGVKSIKGRVKWTGTGNDFTNEVQFSGFHIDKKPLQVSTTDSLTTSYQFIRDDGYMDGEKRTLPVVEQGIIRADGKLSIVTRNEQVRVTGGKDEIVTTEFLANTLDLYAGDAKELLHYKYDCNEQLASKLFGLIGYRAIMKAEGKNFSYEKDVVKIIARLLKNQNSYKMWSWWNNAPETSVWISAHVLRALHAAVEAGYTVPLEVDNLALMLEHRFRALHEYEISDADLLNAMATWGATMDYGRHVKVLDSLIVKAAKQKDRTSRYSLLKDKLLLQEVRQLAHLPFVRDSLTRYQVLGMLGEVSFSDNKLQQYWYNDDFVVNTIAYRIIKRDSVLRKLRTPMQLYFTSLRSKGQWNTYHASNALMSILPDLLSDGFVGPHKPSLILNGKVNAVVDKFPFKLELQPQEELTFKKEGNGPVYFMQYSRERVVDAHSGVNGFEIETTLGSGGALHSGTPVDLRVDVNVTRDAGEQYVMLEIPIPGACSYAEKSRTMAGVETHREYFRDRTVIFCENMKQGKYTFVVHLLPRFTGRYYVNPAQISLMYFPVVNANTEMKKIAVE